jgi:hypothetical protein
MRQVLLVARPDDVRSSHLLLWMDDTIRIGDWLLLHGDYWFVSAVYGTHFSSSAQAARRERPHRHSKRGRGTPIDR